MKKHNVPNGFIRVTDINKQKCFLKITAISHAVNKGKRCLITDYQGNKYYYPHKIKELLKLKGYNFYRIHKSRLINLNHVSRHIHHVFTFKKVIMSCGEILEVAFAVIRFVKAAFRRTNQRCHSWLALRAWNT